MRFIFGFMLVLLLATVFLLASGNAIVVSSLIAGIMIIFHQVMQHERRVALCQEKTAAKRWDRLQKSYDRLVGWEGPKEHQQ
jgi:hypothetical protein